MSRKKALIRAELKTLVATLTGRDPAADGEYVGKLVYGRKGTEFEKVAGTVTGTSDCRLEGCSGTRLHVKWPDGHRTYPCAKGCKDRPDGNLEIG